MGLQLELAPRTLPIPSTRFSALKGRTCAVFFSGDLPVDSLLSPERLCLLRELDERGSGEVRGGLVFGGGG